MPDAARRIRPASGRPLPRVPVFGAPAAGSPRSAARRCPACAPEQLIAWFAERGQPAFACPAAGGRTCGRGGPRRSTTSARSRRRSAPGWPRRFRLDTLPTRRSATADARPDREGAPPPRRRPDDRIGADALPGPGLAARAGDDVHLEPGRLRGGLPVLRDRGAGLLARPGRRRDRGPGAILAAAPRRRRPARHEHRVHGHGRAAAQHGRGAGGGRTRSATRARFGLGARHITISTSGVVPGIERLTACRPQYTLAVSLHAARPALRDLLVPLNRRWPVDRGRGCRDRLRATRPAAGSPTRW